MRKRQPVWAISAGAVLAAGLAGSAALAADMTPAEMQRMLASQQQRLDKLEREARDTKDLEKKLDAVANRIAESAVRAPTVWDRTKLKGDLRYRHEIIDDERSGNHDQRNRHRIRARLGVTHQVNDEVNVTMELATGEPTTTTVVTKVGPPAATTSVDTGTTSPTSTNQTLTGAFANKTVWLSQAYFDYKPRVIPGLSILGGKTPNLFNTPVGNSDLIWDTDINPEGIAAVYKKKVAEGVEVFVQGGGFWVTENSQAADVSLWAVQAGAKASVPGVEGAYVKVGGGYYDYGNVKGKPAVLAAAGNQTTGGAYVDDYDLAHSFAEIGFKVGPLGLAAFGDVVTNLGASDHSSGYLVGGSAAYQKVKVAYNYRMLNNNAVLGSLADGDVWQGNISGTAHKVSGTYALGKNWDASVTGIFTDRDKSNRAGADVQVWQFDLNFKIQ